MADILFKCPECSKALAVGSEHIGKSLACPDCKVTVSIPEPEYAFTCINCKRELQTTNSCSGKSATCPECEVEIVIPPSTQDMSTDTANKCPKCKSNMDEDAVLCVSCGYDTRTAGSLSGIYNNIKEFIKRFKWLFSGGVVGLAIIFAAIIIVHNNQANNQIIRQYNQAIAAAKECKTTDEAISILRNVLARYPSNSLSKDVKALLAIKQKENSTDYVCKAINDSEGKVKALEFNDAISVLREAIIVFPLANNIREAKLLLSNIEQQQKDYQVVIRSITNNTSEMMNLVGKAYSGDAEAELLLGLCFISGSNVVANYREAIKWIASASDKDLTQALLWYGICHTRNNDDKMAFHYFNKAALKGNATAQYYAGKAYLSGQGVGKDNIKGEQLLRASGNQGDARAQLIVGRLMLDGISTNRRPKEACEWIEKSAAQDYAPAQYYLFECLISGRGTPINIPKAIDVLTKSAEQGYGESMAKLISCHLGGYGCETNTIKAIYWIDKVLADSVEDSLSNTTKDNYSNLRKAILVQHAIDTFCVYNDPRFGKDDNLKSVANTIAHYRLKYPTQAECNEMIRMCSIIMSSNNSYKGQLWDCSIDLVKLAVEGSEYILSYEIEMTQKGYHRIAGNWVNDNQLEEINERLRREKEERITGLAKKHREQENALVGARQWLKDFKDSIVMGPRPLGRNALGGFNKFPITNRYNPRRRGGSGNLGSDSTTVLPWGIDGGWDGQGSRGSTGAGEFSKILGF